MPAQVGISCNSAGKLLSDKIDQDLELQEHLAAEDTKKKRKKKKAPAAQAGVQILDLDNTGFHDNTAPIRGPSSTRQGRLALDDDEEEGEAGDSIQARNMMV